MRNKKFVRRKIFKLIILFLCFLALTAACIYSSISLTKAQTDLGNEAFSVASKKLGRAQYILPESQELLKGQKLQGTFVAGDNYLGQILVRFYNFKRINPDSVIFRIKEKGQGDWHYENTYKTNQFQPDKFFTFGFPIISSSKGKKYIFEVESLNGEPGHSIGLSVTRPLGAALYQYPKSLLLSNPKVFMDFIIKNKIKKIQFNEQTLVAFGICLNFIILSLFLIAFALEILLKQKFAQIKINSLNIISTGLMILIISSFILAFKKTDLSYTVSTLGYLVIVAGVFCLIVESKKK